MAELDASMSAKEIREWQAYETVFGPIGGEREDYLAAMLAQRITAMLQMSGGSKVTIKQFIPQWDRRFVDDGESSEPHDPTRD